MSFLLQKLGELGELRNGLNYSRANFGRGLKVIGVKDFGDRWRPELPGLDEIDPTGMRTAQFDLRSGDILFVRSNGNKDLIGRSMLIQEDLEDVSFSGFCIRFRPTDPEINPRFLSLYFRTPLFRRTLSLKGKGTNINNLNQTILKQMDVPRPARVVQDRIIDMAGTYDDLIENNRRRIVLLERAARLLYREWFVHLRFPGYAHVEIVDGVPEGWKRRTLVELAKIVMGQSPKSQFYNKKGGRSSFSPRCNRLWLPFRFASHLLDRNYEACRRRRHSCQCSRTCRPDQRHAGQDCSRPRSRVTSVTNGTPIFPVLRIEEPLLRGGYHRNRGDLCSDE